jgi:hypothetical protein
LLLFSLRLLPFVSPSRDGKNQTTRLETLLAHRDGPGGLFIGTSILLFALMNSAPAELLHPLIDAALQPLLATPLLSQHRRVSAVAEVLAASLDQRTKQRN